MTKRIPHPSVLHELYHPNGRMPQDGDYILGMQLHAVESGTMPGYRYGLIQMLTGQIVGGTNEGGEYVVRVESAVPPMSWGASVLLRWDDNIVRYYDPAEMTAPDPAE